MGRFDSQVRASLFVFPTHLVDIDRRAKVVATIRGVEPRHWALPGRGSRGTANLSEK